MASNRSKNKQRRNAKQTPGEGNSNSPSFKNNSSAPSVHDVLQGKNLEIIVAALLLTGKLRVDSVTLFREATLIVEIVGQYKTLGSADNIEKMTKFFDDNKNMTMEDIMQTFKGNSKK